MKKANLFSTFLVFLILSITNTTFAQFNWDISNSNDISKILPVRKQAEVYNELLTWRLDNIIPKIMERAGIDLWLVINFEYDEDPVYMSLITRPNFSARRLSILIFHNSPTEGFRKLTANWHGSSSCGPMYTNIFTDRSKGANQQFTVVADYIKKHNPNKIGINYAEHWDYHDDFSHGTGLAAFHKEKLEQALGSKYSKKLVSAEKLCIGWLETRSPQELSLYRHICGMAHDLIGEFFSNKVITPDISTPEDVEWWIRQRITEVGLTTWFQPSISIKRSPADKKKYGEEDNVIRRGDILHCDVGIVYLGLCTDMQHNAYVCRIGEDEPPEGIRELLKRGNRIQEILLSEFREGRTGNEILRATVKKATDEGLNPSIYTHPIGVHGHGSGLMIGMVEKQNYVPGTGEHPLYPNTVYSIELSVGYNVPEWDNIIVRTGLEEEAVFTENGVNWVDGYPREYYLIK